MTPAHSPSTWERRAPARRIPVAADMDSGMLERNTAATTATPTWPPPSREAPMATDSGMPSISAPTTMAGAEPSACCPPERFRACPPRRSIARSAKVEGQRAGGQPDDHRRRAAGSVGLRGELEGHGADEHAGTERHHQADRPLRDVEPEADYGAEQQRRSAHEPP